MQDHEFTCADCGKLSPRADEGETITKQHGWRLTRSAVGGVVVVEARCPTCYARSRASLPPSTARRRRDP
jgi:hypothetical protein